MNTEHLKSLTRDAIAAINRGDIERAVSYTAPDCTLNGEPYGREGDRLRAQMMATAFPDGQWIIDDLIAEDDKVLMRWTFRGTHQGALASIPVPPSAKRSCSQASVCIVSLTTRLSNFGKATIASRCCSSWGRFR